MKRFIITFGLFSILFLAIILSGLLIARITNPQNLYFSLIDKHEQLRQVDPPRIVFIGGSNLSFGLNSKQIQDQLNIKVINTAVHAGLGLKYIIEDIIPYLKKKDIVVLSPEYQHFYGSLLYGQEAMINAIVAVPETLHLINLQNWKALCRSLPERAFKNIIKYFIALYHMVLGIEYKGVYNRDSFNKFGDAVAHYGKPSKPFSKAIGMSKSLNLKTFELILSLKNEVEAKDGKFFFAYPCLIRTSFNSIISYVKEIDKELNKIGVTTLGTADKYSLPDHLYFDTRYHLSKEGAELRTKLLINDLRQHYPLY